MRVTSNMFPTALVGQLNRLNHRQSQLQNQISTGQRIQDLQDDPRAMQSVMDMEQAKKMLNQQQRNLSRLKSTADASFAAINSLKKVSDRASEIATTVDGLESPEQVKFYAVEITQLIKQAVQVANSHEGGQYLFAGTKAGQPPFEMVTDANGRVTQVNYRGNEAALSAEVPGGNLASVQVPGANSSGAGMRGLVSDSRVGADFFQHLIALQDHLVAGDAQAVMSTDQANLAKDEENLMYHVSYNGTAQAHLNLAESLGSQELLSLEGRISAEADTDIAAAAVQLNQMQTAFQAALQSAGSLMRTSLLDYLR